MNIHIIFPTKYQADFKAAENRAMQLKKGLWADDACVKETGLLPAAAPKEEESPFSCNISKNCSQMTSCDEAYFYVDTCGKTSLDRDKDGVPCETICP